MHMKKDLGGQWKLKILGDNVFVGNLPILSNEGDYCTICTIEVKDASQYGVYDVETETLFEKPTHKNMIEQYLVFIGLMVVFVNMLKN